jgi:predicted transposase YdaD
LDKARDVLDRDRLSPKERKTYDYLQNIRSHELSMIASSKLEGREEGREEGRIEGRKEGREEGRIEREKLEKDLEKLTKEHEAILAELSRLRETKDK